MKSKKRKAMSSLEQLNNNYNPSNDSIEQICVNLYSSDDNSSLSKTESKQDTFNKIKMSIMKCKTPQEIQNLCKTLKMDLSKSEKEIKRKERKLKKRNKRQSRFTKLAHRAIGYFRNIFKRKQISNRSLNNENLCDNKANNFIFEKENDHTVSLSIKPKTGILKSKEKIQNVSNQLADASITENMKSQYSGGFDHTPNLLSPGEILPCTCGQDGCKDCKGESIPKSVLKATDLINRLRGKETSNPGTAKKCHQCELEGCETCEIKNIPKSAKDCKNCKMEGCKMCKIEKELEEIKRNSALESQRSKVDLQIQDRTNESKNESTAKSVSSIKKCVSDNSDDIVQGTETQPNTQLKIQDRVDEFPSLAENASSFSNIKKNESKMSLGKDTEIMYNMTSPSKKSLTGSNKKTSLMLQSIIGKIKSKSLRASDFYPTAPENYPLRYNFFLRAPDFELDELLVPFKAAESYHSERVFIADRRLLTIEMSYDVFFKIPENYKLEQDIQNLVPITLYAHELNSLKASLSQLQNSAPRIIQYAIMPNFEDGIHHHNIRNNKMYIPPYPISITRRVQHMHRKFQFPSYFGAFVDKSKLLDYKDLKKLPEMYAMPNQRQRAIACNEMGYNRMRCIRNSTGRRKLFLRKNQLKDQLKDPQPIPVHFIFKSLQRC